LRRKKGLATVSVEIEGIFSNSISHEPVVPEAQEKIEKKGGKRTFALPSNVDMGKREHKHIESSFGLCSLTDGRE